MQRVVQWTRSGEQVSAKVFRMLPGFGARSRSASTVAKAQYDLAAAYMEGNGVAMDRSQGLKWLKKSAAQGYVGAEATLGYMYQNGVEVVKDPEQAAAWYRKAARQQNAKAQGHLAELLAKGFISKQQADWQSPELTPKPPKPPTEQQPPPFSLAEIETGLTGGVTPRRLSTLVNTYGVNFDLNDAARQRLTGDGADDTLLATISGSRR